MGVTALDLPARVKRLVSHGPTHPDVTGIVGSKNETHSRSCPSVDEKRPNKIIKVTERYFRVR